MGVKSILLLCLEWVPNFFATCRLLFWPPHVGNRRLRSARDTGKMREEKIVKGRKIERKEIKKRIEKMKGKEKDGEAKVSCDSAR